MQGRQILLADVEPDKHSPRVDCTVDDQKHSAHDHMVEVTMRKLSATPAEELTRPGTQVHICNDETTNTYDADTNFWCYANVDTPKCLTDCEDINAVNKTSLQDINNIIDELSDGNTTPLTDEILEKKITEGWTLSAEVNPTIKLAVQGQMDSGANTCVTNNRRLLKHYKNTKSIPVAGINDNGPACYIQGYGYMDIVTEEGDWLSIKTYYAPQCSGTIISPNAIVQDHPEYTSWNQTSHLDKGEATLKLFNRSSWYKKKTIKMIKQNNLWFIKQPILNMIRRASKYPEDWNYRDIAEATINLTKAAQYELWHQRLLHPSSKIMTNMSKCVDGVPNSMTAHQFHHCSTCAEAKATYHRNRQKELSPSRIGERFHMDFGFMSAKKNGNIVRSHDGFNSYLLVLDAKTRYLWVFLSRNKLPPLQTVGLFLQTHGQREGTRIVRTDQGGELARSEAFRNIVAREGYTVETTSPNSSSQNGAVERPHRTLANMVRSAITDASLDMKYWSDALVHSVYIKNRLPHAAFKYNSTPYTQMTGNKPNLSQLRIFGTPITTRKPGKRPVKLDLHCYHGKFLRYAKTMKNVVYLDNKSRKIKTTASAQFDEAQYSQRHRSRGAKRLFDIGCTTNQNGTSLTNHESDIKIQLTDAIGAPRKKTLFVTPTHKEAYLPTRGSEGSAGLDLHALTNAYISPGGTTLIDTGIAVTLPQNTYGRVASRSGLALKHGIETKAGVIDPDYTGSIKIILHNFGQCGYQVSKGDRIAQLIVENYTDTTVISKHDKRITDRSDHGFGSTGLGQTKTSVHTTVVEADNDMIDMIWQSPTYTTTVAVSTKTNHKTLGLILKNSSEGIQILDCMKGTPSAKINQWRTTIKHGHLRKVGDRVVTSTQDVEQAISSQKANDNITLHVSTREPIEVHPQTGIPQIHFDQLGIISHIHHEIKHDEKLYFDVDEAPPLDNAVIRNASTPTLTRNRLKQQDDWVEWQEAEKDQLDLYESQNMFGEPGPLPTGDDEFNVLPMIWTYLVKVGGRRKARCVANGAPHLKGSVTLANTYAACLEQTGARIFWAIAAFKNKKIYGSDASNAFAEAPPPKAPLYLRVDSAYREWYRNKTGKDIPEASYVRVQHAIQGHPEAPRLWQDHIEGIIQKLGFTATKMEPCIYILKKGEFDEDIFLLRQVDDFAIACANEETAETIFQRIDDNLNAPLKREGLIKRYNGVDIVQSASHIKVHCGTYIDKITKTKRLHDMTTDSTKPRVPISWDSKYMEKFDTSIGPMEESERDALAAKKGFKFRQATGELLFAMVTCRPDIAFAVLKLTQHNINPAEIHYDAAIEVYKYLLSTKEKGIQYWRQQPNSSLPNIPPDQLTTGDNYVPDYNPSNIPTNLAYAFVDADWAGNSANRKSLSGIAVMFAGAVIAYKTITQQAVALSTTEAELYALAEAGKTMLYIRTILDDLNISQTPASVLYEDNQGCMHITAAKKPTKRTRHVDIRQFAIIDWIEKDLIDVSKILTSDNASDALTKPQPRILFHRHNDTMMGRRRPIPSNNMIYSGNDK